MCTRPIRIFEPYAIQKQQIKCEEHTFPTTKQQIIEDRTPTVIDTCNLAIEYGILDAQVLADPLSQIFEVAGCVSVAPDQIAVGPFSM
jgi:hypothetical protein